MPRSRCEAMVERRRENGTGRTQCFNLATATRDGRHYCGTHDPVRREERRPINRRRRALGL